MLSTSGLPVGMVKKKLVNSLVYFRPRAFAISNELAMVGSPNIWAMNSSNGKKSNSYALSQRRNGNFAYFAPTVSPHSGLERRLILYEQVDKLDEKILHVRLLAFFFLKCQSMQESMQEAWCKMPNSLFMAVSVKYCNKNNKKTRRGQIIQRYHLLKIFKLSPSEVSFRGPKQYLH